LVDAPPDRPLSSRAICIGLVLLHWSDDVPGWLQGVCLLTVAAGYALALWAMRVNRSFSSVIRIQTDRGQRVVTQDLTPSSAIPDTPPRF
jgi:protein-S-isoprenylcysteine O-methyltransferase Ste14